MAAELQLILVEESRKVRKKIGEMRYKRMKQQQKGNKKERRNKKKKRTSQVNEQNKK